MVQRRDAILNQVFQRGAVPSLSPLVVKLVEMASDDEASAKDLAGVIEQSPGLTARLLRLVNSPAHRVSESEVTGVQRAVVLLGLREVRIMALSISLRDTLPVKKNDSIYHAFWRGSLHRAALARQTARELIPDLAEEAFVAGLLLELGLPLLLDALTDEESTGFPGVDASLDAQLLWERENLGLDHRETGVMLMERWELPPALRDCLAFRLGEEAPVPPDLPAVSDFARRAAEALFSPEDNLTRVHRLADEVFGLEPARTNSILASAMEYLGQAADALEIDLDHEADLLGLMEKANAALGRISRRMAPAIAEAARSGKDEALKEQAMVNALEAVAHEIRNPLMSVGGFARRLAVQASGEGKVKRYAEVIVNEAARLDHALGEMLSLVTPFVPERKEVDLAGLITGLAPVLPDAGGKKPAGRRLDIKLHLPAGPLMVEVDPKGFSEALVKMSGYAAHLLRHENNKPVLHIHLINEGREVVLTLFGEGEPDSGDSGQLVGKSFGPELALAQARRIVEGHGGYLSVGSSPRGKGFVITAALHPARR